MKVAGLETGRVTLLIDLLEIAPLEGMYDVEVVSAIQEKYSFAVTPQPTADAPQLRFERGHGPDGKFIAFFEIHQQGLVVQSTDTRISSAFLNDLLTEGEKLFKLRKPGPLSKTIYLSSLVAEFDTDLGSLLSRSKSLFGLVGSALNQLYEIDAAPNLHTLTIKPDVERLPPRMAGGILGDFTIQRRIFAPYESHRFFSTAPLPTDQHIELLSRIEQMAE